MAFQNLFSVTHTGCPPAALLKRGLCHPQAYARPAVGSRSTTGGSPGGKPYVQRPAVLQAVFSRAALPATASGRSITDDSGR